MLEKVINLKRFLTFMLQNSSGFPEGHILYSANTLALRLCRLILAITTFKKVPVQGPQHSPGGGLPWTLLAPLQPQSLVY
jgi:hypothetical protein